ncbi:MAG: hypothetical protein QOF36_2613 [Microbacteriaceae bacterium]|jgi:hypothetical protein|nr:hypothetical protein [Microbacteriaceae bacterium]
MGNEDTDRLALSERARDARVAVEPDEMPEPHDFERVAPYVFGQPEPSGSCRKV